MSDVDPKSPLANRHNPEEIYITIRAGYGKKLLEYLSDRLTAEFGEGFPVRNLRAMRQFYSVFPIRHTLCAEFSQICPIIHICNPANKPKTREPR